MFMRYKMLTVIALCREFCIFVCVIYSICDAAHGNSMPYSAS